MTEQIMKEFKELPEQISTKAIELHELSKVISQQQEVSENVKLDITQEVTEAQIEVDGKFKNQFSNPQSRSAEIKRRLGESKEYQKVSNELDDNKDKQAFGMIEASKLRRQFIVDEVLLRLTKA